MKVRVYKYGENYFPQYKGWLFWHYIYKQESDLYGASAFYFKSKDEAVAFLEDKNWSKYSEVVWEGKHGT